MDKLQTNLRVQVTLILFEVIGHKMPLEAVFADFLSGNELDRALILELSYGVLRWYYRLEYIASLLLKQSLVKRDFIAHILVLLGLYQLIFTRIPKYAAVFETVAAARILKKNWLVAVLNGVLRSFLRAEDRILDIRETQLAAYYSHPQWLIEKFQQLFPEKWREILLANNQHPPMHLRVNLKRITREEYCAQNTNAVLHPLVATAVSLKETCKTENLPGYAAGMVSVQDVAAQLAAGLLEVMPNMRVLDACAAPGNKAAGILELVPTLQELVALEKDARKLAIIQENPKRLDVQAQVIIGDAREPQTWWDGKLFDRILLDAPCSAVGVIRRHAEIKIIRTLEDVMYAVKLQRELLCSLWPLLAPGGILLYATCSIFPEENTQNIEWFLQKQNDAQEVRIDATWGQKQKFGRQTFPGEHAMDGFYYARLEKTKLM